jgi:DNA-binding winged helix-turn-helix (wHTH) protein
MRDSRSSFARAVDQANRFRIGRLEVDLAARRVRADGAPIHLEPKAFDLLVHLSRHRGEVQSRDALLQAVWGRTVASDAVVAQPIHKLRQVLSGPGREPDAIATVHGVGYRLDAAVTWLDSTSAEVKHRAERRLVIGAALLLAALVAWRQTWRPSSAPAAPRIALLEIENATGNTELDWIQSGGAALIIQELSRRGIEVTSPRQLGQMQVAAGDIEPGEAARSWRLPRTIQPNFFAVVSAALGLYVGYRLAVRRRERTQPDAYFHPMLRTTPSAMELLPERESEPR